MPSWAWIALPAAVALYAAFVLALLAAGRREQARALAGFVPDCAVLCRRLVGDERVPLAHKLALGALAAYLLVPVDLVPDYIPVAGQLDDALLLAIVLRVVLRRAGPDVIAEHWPGSARACEPILRLAGRSAPGPS
jgi:uncharacterized membrane protein YkvA (DUF1232 family)